MSEQGKNEQPRERKLLPQEIKYIESMSELLGYVFFGNVLAKAISSPRSLGKASRTKGHGSFFIARVLDTVKHGVDSDEVESLFNLRMGVPLGRQVSPDVDEERLCVARIHLQKYDVLTNTGYQPERYTKDFGSRTVSSS